MARFIYFIPEVASVTPADLQAVGLANRFPDDEPARFWPATLNCSNGPVGNGCLIAQGNDPPDDTEMARWSQAAGFWVGVRDFMPPQPYDLIRAVCLDGARLTLQNRDWIVPLVYQWEPKECCRVLNLPAVMVAAHDGSQWRYEPRPLPAYSHLAEVSDRAFEIFVTETPGPIDQMFEDAAALLAANYRVGVEELGLLGAMDETDVLRILIASIDGESIREHAQASAMRGIIDGSMQYQLQE